MRPLYRWLAPLATIVASFLLSSGVPVRAAEAAAQTTAAPAKGWEFDIVPYIWCSGLNGNVKIGRVPTQTIDASFEDILDHLGIAAMGAFEARNGRWGLLVDAVYIRLDDTVSGSGASPGEIDVTMKQQLYAAFLTYRFYEGNKSAVEFAWGMRNYQLDNDLEVVSGIAQGLAASADENWWDWLVGVRYIGRPSPRWSLSAFADLGGGGSHLAWEAIGIADFAFNKTVSLAFGYRYLDVDFEQTDFLYDASMQGPFVGVGFHW